MAGKKRGRAAKSSGKRARAPRKALPARWEAAKHAVLSPDDRVSELVERGMKIVGEHESNPPSLKRGIVVPAGRLKEHIAGHPHPDRLAWRDHGSGPFSDLFLKEFKDRWLLAKTIRGEQRKSGPDGHRMWRPAVPLSDGEGYSNPFFSPPAMQYSTIGSLENPHMARGWQPGDSVVHVMDGRPGTLVDVGGRGWCTVSWADGSTSIVDPYLLSNTSASSEPVRLRTAAEYEPGSLGNPDERIRRLERAAAAGDVDARAALERWGERVAPPPPPQPTSLSLPKATIYFQGEFGMGYKKAEVNNLTVSLGPWAQYSSSIHVRYVPKGSRRERGFVQSYQPSLVVLDGWRHFDPPASFSAPVRSGGVEVSRAHYSALDPQWGGDFRSALNAYLASNPKVRLMADYHGWNPHNVIPEVGQSRYANPFFSPPAMQYSTIGGMQNPYSGRRGDDEIARAWRNYIRAVHEASRSSKSSGSVDSMLMWYDEYLRLGGDKHAADTAMMTGGRLFKGDGSYANPHPTIGGMQNPHYSGHGGKEALERAWQSYIRAVHAASAAKAGSYVDLSGLVDDMLTLYDDYIRLGGDEDRADAALMTGGEAFKRGGSYTNPPAFCAACAEQPAAEGMSVCHLCHARFEAEQAAEDREAEQAERAMYFMQDSAGFWPGMQR